LTPNPQTTRIFAFFVASHISVIGHRRDFKILYTGGYIKSYQKNKKNHPKVAWLWSRGLFKFLGPPTIQSPERLHLETSILYTGLPGDYLALWLQTVP